jgi:hypothetical protein
VSHRNLIKKLAKLEDVAGTLEELWISYNMLKTLDDINVLENLQVQLQFSVIHFLNTKFYLSFLFHALFFAMYIGIVYWKQPHF